MPEQGRNSSHVSDPKIIFDIQRYAAEQQYYVYLNSIGATASWPSYLKNYAPNLSFDYGNRAAALWLEKS